MEKKIDAAIGVAKGILLSRTSAEDFQKVAQSILNLSHARSINDGDSSEDEELTFVLGKIRPSVDATMLVQLTQAALNLMNAKALLTGKMKKKPGASAS